MTSDVVSRNSSSVLYGAPWFRTSSTPVGSGGRQVGLKPAPNNQSLFFDCSFCDLMRDVGSISNLGGGGRNTSRSLFVCDNFLLPESVKNVKKTTIVSRRPLSITLQQSKIKIWIISNTIFQQFNSCFNKL